MTMQRDEDDWDLDKAFEETYQQEFGFTLEGRSIIVDDVRCVHLCPAERTDGGRVRGIGKAHSTMFRSPFQEAEETDFRDVEAADEQVSVYFEETGRVDVPLFRLEALKAGDAVHGPAIVLQDTQTTVLEPGWRALVLGRHLLLELASAL
jgi:5-oxoprolinase (ATP-hydrolysing)